VRDDWTSFHRVAAYVIPSRIKSEDVAACTPGDNSPSDEVQFRQPGHVCILNQGQHSKLSEKSGKP